MADQVVETTRKGLGSRLGESIKGVVFGILLFFASFIVLFWNEGRVDISGIAKGSVEVNPSAPSPDSSLEGKLVAVTGPLKTGELLGDDLFLKPGPYIALEREAEMFAWKEHKKEESKKEVGGSETTTTTYTYTKEWVSNPQSSGSFKESEGHLNPAKKIDDFEAKIPSASIGIYETNPGELDLPGLSKLRLKESMVHLSRGAKLASDEYIYLGSGSYATPMVGDLRISYRTLPAGADMTVFGKLHVRRVVPFLDEDDNRLYHARSGGRDSAIATLHSEHVFMTWILRLGGFLMMWFGLFSLFGPISTFLDILPVLGSLSRGLIGVIAFVVSLVLSIVTIVVSMIVHSLVAVIITLAVVIAGGIFLAKMMKKRKVAAAPAAA